MAKLNPKELLMAERVFSTKELADIAQNLGWNHERTKGSHQIFSRVGWKENLSIPAHREYEWGVAKGVLHKILAPLRDQVPDLQLKIDEVEGALAQFLTQSQKRISAYETQKIEEVDLLLKADRKNLARVEDLELRLAQREEELHFQREKANALKAEYEAQIHDERLQVANEIGAFRLSLKASADDCSKFNRHVAQLRQERDQMRKSRAIERRIAGVGLGILSAIALGTILTQLTGEPAQKSLSPPLNSQPQRAQ